MTSFFDTVLVEELLILGGEGALWEAARPLLDAVLRLDQNDDIYTWHGWQKGRISAFLAALPSPCSLVAGVWDTLPAAGARPAQDKLVLGVVCAVEQGEIRSICTFEHLVVAGLKPVDELEIGMEDALEIVHYARRQVAPVAWALFSEKAAWDEWLFTSTDKHQLLDELVSRGRCVLMGSQAASKENP